MLHFGFDNEIYVSNLPYLNNFKNDITYYFIYLFICHCYFYQIIDVLFTKKYMCICLR